MYEGLLIVKCLTSKNCRCFLSSTNLKHLQNNVVKLLYNDNEVTYVSVDSSSGEVDEFSFGINSLFAKALGLDGGSLVAVSEVPKPPTIQSVTITAIDDNDHYVLESLAENVQSTLLGQIRVLRNGQKFIIWIGETLHVTVTAYNIKPISPGVIDNLTEVIIKPPGIEKQFKYQNNRKKINNDNKQETLDFLTDYVDKPENLILRAVPSTELVPQIAGLSHPFNAFVFREAVSYKIQNTCTSPKIFKVKYLNNENEEKNVFVRLYVFEDFTDLERGQLCAENIFLTELLMEHFNCEVGSRIVLEPYNEPLPEIKELEIYTKKNYSIIVTEIFQQYLADTCKEHEFVLNCDVIWDVAVNLRCFVRFQPCQAKFCMVTPDFVRNCKLVVINESLPEKEIVEKNEFSLRNYRRDVANYNEIINDCLFFFGFNIKVFSKMNNVLITGKPGTGKTALVKIVTHIIQSFPYFIYTKKINCKSIKGKTVESLHKLFTTTFFDLIHHQPSVLILDDLQVLCESVNEGDALTQNGVYFNRVSEMLEGVFQKFCQHNAVGILTTAISTSELNKNIYATRGNHLFKNVCNIKQLEKNDRRKLLEFLFLGNELDNVDLDKFAAKTESFVMQHMVDFANKTLFESYQEGYDQDVVKITTEHCETALEIVTQTSLADANLHPPGDRDLDDIGGLTDAKKMLIEIMLWPAKYPNLFTNAPLRLASGFLLYGPPGTGKTILAGAAAKHCGLRLISIKGPELLSKYIGASEQAVRDVFQRAQSVKPCVLFFDEFDSLAPRRGHDNTGVTDRVVNQLLTQLDGVESLSDVFVLAATSRPDLLDPALLRPGRLDLHIRCPLPDKNSRLEILKVLSKSLNLSSDVNLEELADATDGFSGADLQAVLYSAQLDSFKGLLEDEKNIQEFQTQINQVQLMEALKSTRPSLSPPERLKYDLIYRHFETGGSSNFSPGSRATLA